jgi:hypothetical protein
MLTIVTFCFLLLGSDGNSQKVCGFPSQEVCQQIQREVQIEGGFGSTTCWENQENVPDPRPIVRDNKNARE